MRGCRNVGWQKQIYSNFKVIGGVQRHTLYKPLDVGAIVILTNADKQNQRMDNIMISFISRSFFLVLEPIYELSEKFIGGTVTI